MSEHPGTALTSTDWLAGRVDDLARAWSLPDLRVAGTLWWYMAADTVLGPVVSALSGDAVPDPALESVSLTLRADGSVAAIRHRTTVEPDDAITRLAQVLSAVLDALAEVSGAARASLAAITTDAVANRSLVAPDPVTRATDVAARIAVPAPRFVDVAGRRFVRRASCCLIYRSARAGMCVSCPKRDPDERATLLAESAAG